MPEMNLTILDWRQPKYDKVCPSCLSAMLNDGGETSTKGTIAFYKCGNVECGRREMLYEKPQEKAREY